MNIKFINKKTSLFISIFIFFIFSFFIQEINFEKINKNEFVSKIIKKTESILPPVQPVTAASDDILIASGCLDGFTSWDTSPESSSSPVPWAIAFLTQNMQEGSGEYSRFVDLNGDGLTDYLFSANYGSQDRLFGVSKAQCVLLNNGNGYDIAYRCVMNNKPPYFYGNCSVNSFNSDDYCYMQPSSSSKSIKKGSPYLELLKTYPIFFPSTVGDNKNQMSELVDLNSDGLLDYVHRKKNLSNQNGQLNYNNSVCVFLNTGAGWKKEFDCSIDYGGYYGQEQEIYEVKGSCAK